MRQSWSSHVIAVWRYRPVAPLLPLIALLMLSIGLYTPLRAQSANCQPYSIYLSYPEPLRFSADSSTIELCAPATLTLRAGGEYIIPPGGYPQTDDSTRFRWQWADDTVGYGSLHRRHFARGGIYALTLSSRDQRGCPADTALRIRVIVSAPPVFAVDRNFDDTLCVGQPQRLMLRGEPTATATPRPLEYPTASTNSDSTAIPDGNARGIRSVIDVPGPPDSVITRPGQLPLICANLEHSSLYDLTISLECPSGQRVLLHPFTERSNEVHLGIPNLNDENGGPTQPGRAGNYCWGRSGKLSWNDFLEQHNSPPAAVFSVPAGTYAAATPLDQLLGCPVAGPWTLHITDSWSVNNGWLLGWSLHFPSDPGTYVPVVTQTDWTLPPSVTVASRTADSIVFRPDRSGPLQLVFTATDTLGCTADTSLNLTVLPAESAYCSSLPGQDDCNSTFTILGQRNSSCAGADDGQLFLQFRGSTAGYSLLLNERPLPPAPMIDSLAPGNYRLTYTNGTGCSQVDSFRIDEPEPLRLRLATQQPPRCAGTTTGMVELAASGGSADYRYRLDSLPYTAEPQFSGLASGTYRASVLDSLGCTDSLSFRLSEPDSLQITFNTQPVGCQGAADGAISARVSGGTGSYRYRWSNGSTRPDQGGLAAGRYCLTVTDGVGCTLTRCETLAIPATLQIDTIISTMARCYGEASGQAVVRVAGGLPPYRYRWNDPLAQLADTAVLLSAGTYTVVVTDSRGCTAQGTTQVGQPDTLMSRIELTNVSCLGLSNGRARALVSGGRMPYRFDWSGGGMRQGESIDGLAPGTYQVTITDAGGCKITDSLSISEPGDSLRLGVEQLRSGCQGLRQNVVRATAAGGYGNFRFQWSDGREGAELTGVDTGRLIVTLTDAGGCRLRDTVVVRDLPAVDFLLITEPPTCRGDNNGAMGITRLSGGAGQSESDYTFAWSTGSREIAITNLSGGREYGVTVTGPAGCTRERRRLLPDPEPVSFELESQPVSCYGGKDGAVRLVNVTGPNDTLFTIRWNEGAGMVKGREITGLPAGRYTLTVTDSEGCSETGLVTIAQPEPLRLSLTTQEPNCFGVAGGSIATQISGGVGPYRFSWSNGQQGAAIEQLPAGDYAVTATDEAGCTISARTSLRSPNNIATDTQVRAVTCAGDRDGRISITPQGGTPPYRYSLNDIDYSGSNTFVGLSAGNYTIFIRDGEGCTYLTATTVPEPPAISVTLGPDRSIAYGDSLTLSGVVAHAIGTVDYFWEAPYPGTLSCTNCPQPTARPVYDIDYQLTVVDENGCEASDRVRVDVEKIRLVAVPTGFTPNQDGKNDRLLVHGQPGTEVARFEVFDRWGELVFSAEDFAVNKSEAGWDGYFNGQPAEIGVYVWRATVRYPDGSQETLSGQTMLSR